MQLNGALLHTRSGEKLHQVKGGVVTQVRPSKLDLPGTAGSYASTPWLGSNPRGLYLPGAAGHYASVPDVGASSWEVVGDIDVRVRVGLADWTPSTSPYLINCDGFGNGWNFRVLAGGPLLFRWRGSVGPADVQVQSTTLTGIVDSKVEWVRATLDVSNGSGVWEVCFYKSAVVDPMPGDWTLVGAPVVGAAATSIVYTAARSLAIGAYYSGSFDPATGLFQRAQVRNGIDGPVVFDVDFTDESQGWAVGDSAGATGVDATGKTVTIAGAGSVIRSILDVTRDIDVRVRVPVGFDWTPAATSGLVCRFEDGPGGWSWLLLLDNLGRLILFTSPDNAALVSATSSASIPAGTRRVRITRSAATGTVTFETSATDAEDWVALGTPQATAAGGIYAGSAPLVIGSDRAAGTTSMLNDSLLKVEVRDGIDGTIVASPDFSAIDPGTTNFEDFQGNVWSINGSAQVVAA